MEPSLVPYIVVLVASGASTTALSVVGWRYRTAIGADWFTATMALDTVWVALWIAMLLVDGEQSLFVLDVLSTVVALSVPVLWFTFVLEYTGRGRLVTKRTLAVLWTIPLLSFLAILTESVHDLYFAAVEPAEIAGLALVETPPGPLAMVALVYIYSLFLVGLWLVAGMLSEHDRLFSGQGLWLFLGTLAPVAVGVAQAVGAVPEGLPLLPAGLSVMGLAYGFSLFHHRLFDLSPATRRIGADEAFDDLEEGVIIVDGDTDVVAINESACEQFGCEKAAVLGDALGAVSPAIAAGVPLEESRDVTRNSRVLEVSRSAVHDTRSRHTGYALVVRDVTAQRGRKQRLEVLNRILRHNLRNDMAVVQGYASELARRQVDDDDAEMAAAVEQTAADLMGLAEKARDIERTITTAEADRRPVALASMLHGIVHGIERAYPGRSVAVTAPEDLTVVTDAPTLELVLQNVVENAVEHGSTNPRSQAPEDADEKSSSSPRSFPPEDAVEHGSTSPDSQAREENLETPEAPAEFTGTSADGDDGVDVRIRAKGVAGGIEITVSDDGPGIPQSELDVIERGTETDLDHCSGLGLWLVRWGATRLGADLAFETRDGTTVRITLPET